MKKITWSLCKKLRNVVISWNLSNLGVINANKLEQDISTIPSTRYCFIAMCKDLDKKNMYEFFGLVLLKMSWIYLMYESLVNDIWFLWCKKIQVRLQTKYLCHDCMNISSWWKRQNRNTSNCTRHGTTVVVDEKTS